MKQKMQNKFRIYKLKKIIKKIRKDKVNTFKKRKVLFKEKDIFIIYLEITLKEILIFMLSLFTIQFK